MTAARPTDFPLSEPAYSNKRVRDLSPFLSALDAFPASRIAELDDLLAGQEIPAIQAAMTDGDLNAEELVLYYLDRVRRYDIDKLNAFMELNPDALQIARDLDRERAERGIRGPMHGIPVLLKDNIATGDRLHSAAGAYALRNWRPPRDAFLVQQLRTAGAVVLGKANLSEWANWMDPGMPNGFSTLGGQTRHPYGPYDPVGSSSGSAVAVAADMVTVSVGSETRGSIISPAEANSIVGLKTSLGLVSRDLIIPLVDRLDVPGPMGRTVTDVAVMLTAMTGADLHDPATARAETLIGVDFTQYLGQSVAGLRMGVLVHDGGEADQTSAELDSEAASADRLARDLAAPFRDLGMDVVEINIAALPAEPDLMDVLNHGFKAAIDRFLQEVGGIPVDGETTVRSLADVIAINQADPSNRIPYGNGRLVDSQTNTVSDEAYAAMVEQGRQVAQRLHALFVSADVDVMLINAATAVYATAGFPALTVPAGYAADGKPVGVTLMADFLGEPVLLTVGHAYEQATRARRTPDLEAAIDSFFGLANATPSPGE